MLPFLQPKKASSVIMMKAKPEGGMEVEKEEGEHSPGLVAAAQDLISAIHSKDVEGVCRALMAADEIMDAEQEEFMEGGE